MLGREYNYITNYEQSTIRKVCESKLPEYSSHFGSQKIRQVTYYIHLEFLHFRQQVALSTSWIQPNSLGFAVVEHQPATLETEILAVWCFSASGASKWTRKAQNHLEWSLQHLQITMRGIYSLKMDWEPAPNWFVMWPCRHTNLMQFGFLFGKKTWSSCSQVENKQLSELKILSKVQCRFKYFWF